MKLPSYRKHCSGQARVTIRGRDHLLGLYGSRESKAKYRELIQKYLETKPELQVLKGDGSLGHCLAVYLDHAKVYYAQSREYITLKHSLSPFLEMADRKAIDFGPKAAKEFREIRIAKSVSRQFINKVMSHVKRFVKWCVSEELMNGDQYQSISCIEPLKAGRTKLREAEPIKPVELAVVDATIEKLPGVVADMVRLQRLTAARPAEICAITPGMVVRSNEVWEIQFEQHKNSWRGKSRTVYVGYRGQAILANYLNRGSDVPCFSPREAMEQRRAAKAASRKTPPNQGNRRGYGSRTREGRNECLVASGYNTTTYRRAIEYACKLAKVDKWAPNQLRHTRSTEIRKTHGLEASQVILGHAKCDVTRVYAEAYQELAIKVAKLSG
jgi:integrase